MYKKGDGISQQEAQNLAVNVARQGAGFVSPNPLVGCVIVDGQHHFLSSGFHALYGGPHAEVNAFRTLSIDELVGSTVYVTLEPCSHYGKTPPCVELFLNKGIQKVVVGLQDPNPLVAGQGLERLRQNKICVETDIVFSRQCEELTEIFLYHMQYKLPFVALKVAMSADGFIASADKKPLAITGETTRLYARELRAQYDATLIGAETFLQDDPLLDFRGTPWQGQKDPRVVILDPHGRAEEFFPRSKMATSLKRENLYFVKSIERTSLQEIYQNQIYSLYVEGGAQTHRLFVEQKLFQKLYCFIAAQKQGSGLPWLWRPSELAQDLIVLATQQIGSDHLTTYTPRHN